MTDLEKWKTFLDQMNIKYQIKKDVCSVFNNEYTSYVDIVEIILEIDKSYLSSNYPALYIFFAEDGAFKHFTTLGD